MFRALYENKSKSLKSCKVTVNFGDMIGSFTLYYGTHQIECMTTYQSTGSYTRGWNMPGPIQISTKDRLDTFVGYNGSQLSKRCIGSVVPPSRSLYEPMGMMFHAIDPMQMCGLIISSGFDIIDRQNGWMVRWLELSSAHVVHCNHISNKLMWDPLDERQTI